MHCVQTRPFYSSLTVHLGSFQPAISVQDICLTVDFCSNAIFALCQWGLSERTEICCQNFSGIQTHTAWITSPILTHRAKRGSCQSMFISMFKISDDQNVPTWSLSGKKNTIIQMENKNILTELNFTCLLLFQTHAKKAPFSSTIFI